MYTSLAILMVLIAVIVDLFVLKTRLLLRGSFWITYVILFFFQFLTNGVLTGLGIVQYDEAQILGLRLGNAPVEDMLFGFSLVVLILSSWVKIGPSTSKQSASLPTEAVAQPERIQ